MTLQGLVAALFAALAVVLLVVWLVALYVLVDGAEAWMQAVMAEWWIAPLLLVIVGGLYLSIRRAMLEPLQNLSEAMGRVVQAQNPGFQERHPGLQPGLAKLHRYLDGLTELATHDPLTRLSNRIIFEEKLKQALLDGRRTGMKFALVFIDIDEFYRVNHEFGSYIADALLRQLAGRLSDNLRESDTLARLEKDNFALLLDFSDIDQLGGLLDKLHQQLVKPYSIYGREVRVSVCLGAAVYPDHGRSMVEIALQADDALNLAQGGDWPVVIARRTQDRGGITVVQALRRGIERNEFELVFQPVVHLDDHQTSYFEALLRWQEPEQHEYPIGQIIQMAESSQLIRPLTNWILDTACRQLATHASPGISIAVNLSMIDLHDDRLPERIRKVLDKHSVAAKYLQIEITEGQIMQEPDQVIHVLEQLNAMGLSLTIDDFGTGQASLTYLRRLPVSKLKIDQSFIKDMLSNAEDRAIVEATIRLAHTLDIEVVAEGVESVAVCDLLESMGCDYVQGYYISRPLDHDQIMQWCSSREARSAS